MIKGVRIRNYQSHKRTVMEFVDGVNIIIGASDGGKTAIIRAIRWVLQNRPTGEGFRSRWGGNTSVQLTTDTDTITRLRTDTENQYTLNETVFNAVKTDVPVEVQRALNMDSINLQMQLDGIFLLSSTPGEVAHHFNRVAGLDKIDTAQANVMKWLRELGKDVEVKEGLVKKAEEELTHFTHIEKFETDVEVLEEQEKELSRKRTYKNQLKVLCEQIQEVEGAIDGREDILHIEPLLTQILTNVTLKREKQGQYTKLKEICREIKENGASLKELQALLPAETLINQIIVLTQQRTDMERKQENLRRLVKQTLTAMQRIKEVEHNHERLHKEFGKEMGNVCILCGQPIKQ